MEQNKENIPTVNLPALPASWEAVTADQLIEINRLRRISKSEQEYRFRVFCFLEQIVLEKKVRYAADGNELFFFTQVDAGGNRMGDMFPMQAWTIHEAVTEYLPWLFSPCNRLSDIVPYITIGERKYASTGHAMARMTYQQHQYASLYFNEIQRLEASVVNCVINGGSDEQLKVFTDKITHMRHLFMATVFTPECRVGSKTVDGKVVVYEMPQTDYVFSSEQVEKEYPNFAKVKDELIDAVMQLFNGVMMHYQKIYPLLFKEGSTGSTDMIKVEESTLNALQSELKFANYQTIYDSNAPFILGKLNAIMLKAEEIERMHEKMKHR